MKIEFSKYQGAGNDFVMIDDRALDFPVQIDVISKICDRHFGIGADGLILLQNDETSDFKMIYFNADGKIGSMCGNGGRCIVRFANDLGLIGNHTEFNAADGLHKAAIDDDVIGLSMSDVLKVETHADHVFLDTGSPHHVLFVEDVNEIDVKTIGAKIRYGAPYFEKGSNVNFVQLIDKNTIKIRTYERGVEDETLACGTGVTAAAIAVFEIGEIKTNEIHVKAVGGDLKVDFSTNQGTYRNIRLSGPAEFVFKGEIEI